MPRSSLWRSFHSWRYSGLPAEEFFRRQRVNKKKQKTLLEKWDALQTSSKDGDDKKSEVRPAADGGKQEAKGKQTHGGTVRSESELLSGLKI